MGIDIYMYWDGMTKEEKEAQYTGWSVTKGHVGYLREAYHGAPYATMYLLKECFLEPNKNLDNWKEIIKPAIPVKHEYYDIKEICDYHYPDPNILINRLPKTIELCIERSKNIYLEDIDYNHEVCKTFSDFVELYVKKFNEGLNPRIHASF